MACIVFDVRLNLVVGDCWRFEKFEIFLNGDMSLVVSVDAGMQMMTNVEGRIQASVGCGRKTTVLHAKAAAKE